MFQPDYEHCACNRLAPADHGGGNIFDLTNQLTYSYSYTIIPRTNGLKSPYVEYAPKFAELAHAQGAKVVLYETTPVIQNETPLTAPPDAAPVLAKERTIA